MDLPLDTLFARRLLLVTGKGGVGKTTVAAALALAAARSGRRVLLAQFESQVDVGALLGQAPVATKVVSVGERLDAVNMTPRASLREFGMLVFRMRAIQRAVMENRMVRGFLRAIPGLDDYAMLGKAWHHTTELRGGASRYDLVVVDGPATGQMLKTLAVPRAIVQVVPDSMLTRDAAAIQAVLQDPAQTAVVLVTLAEELPTSETLELQTALIDDLAMPVWGTVVNQVYPASGCADLLEALWPGAMAGSEPRGGRGSARTRSGEGESQDASNPRATPPGGMDRRPNADDASPRASGRGRPVHPTVKGLLHQARVLARRREVNDRHLAVLSERAVGALGTLPLLFVDRLDAAHLRRLLPQRVER